MSLAGLCKAERDGGPLFVEWIALRLSNPEIDEEALMFPVRRVVCEIDAPEEDCSIGFARMVTVYVRFVAENLHNISGYRFR